MNLTHSKVRFVFAVWILALVSSPAILAQSVSSESKVTGLAGNGESTVLCDQGSVTGPVATSNCSGSYSDYLTTGTANSQSSATYGVLRGYAYASSVAAQGSYGPSAGASATSDFTDFLTFSGLDGTAILQETISLIGTENGNNCYVSSPNNQICGSASADFASFFSGQTGCDITSGSCTTSISVNDNSQVNLYGMLSVQASIGGNIAGGANAEANYLDTAMVNSLVLVDANGNPISGADIITASGTNYNALSETTPPVGAPEPCSLGLLGLGVLGLIGLRRWAAA